ncbi:tRNA (adenosine(37)-N6)-threonylcarbamoyltransferase complex ATPase subunit type 1 TsaE [Candidatus Kapabacteria bacterium]|nr:tRNA (adenosine(37)-N6)-threonylcarbamoyltransferase complex ATPase subunit type 1 TsaE [Candidatus Kapabacteria bacterium]
MKTFSKETSSPEQTFSFGKEFGMKLEAGNTIAFFGGLGAGKTEFIKGICLSLGSKQMVTSPTFAIINQYDCVNTLGIKTVYHFDLYRLKSEEELFDIGFHEIMDDDSSVKLIEWSENSFKQLPKDRIEIYIKTSIHESENRSIEIKYL